MENKEDSTETSYKPTNTAFQMEPDHAHHNEEEEEEDGHEKFNKKVFFKRARAHFQSFSEKTSLHGVQYVGERNRPILERICWVIILAVSIYLCMGLIRKAWMKWNTTPVIVSLSETPVAIWEVPFPAVTICPEVKCRKSAFAYSETLHKKSHTPEELTILNAISLLCDHDRLSSDENTTDPSFLNILESVAPKFDDIFLSCSYHGLQGNCSDFFTKTLTAEGWCYSFNILHGSEIFKDDVWNAVFCNGNKSLEWSVDKGYVDQDFSDDYPQRAFSIGNKGALEVLLNAYDFDYDYSCRGPTQGFKLALHSPYDFPQIENKYLMLPTEEAISIAVKPEMSTAADELREYDPRIRKCFFPDEKSLYFFDIYSQENCEVECLTNWTLIMCECVPFHMPHHNDTAICGPEKMECVQNAPLFAQTFSFMAEVVTKNNAMEKQIEMNCICLPACTALTYNIETMQADFDWKEFPKVIPDRITNTTGIQLTKLSIFYKDFYFQSLRRSELYGRTDFLATCGGLLGLFMGFSFISFIEIFYFLTIRICGNIALRNKQFWRFLRLRKDESHMV